MQPNVQIPYPPYNGAPQAGPPVVPQVPIEVPEDPKSPTTLIFAIVVISLLAIGSLAFAIAMYLQAQDYKNNVDKKIQAAIVVANEKQKKELDEAFAEKEKSPLKTYISPSDYGDVEIVYPKTWSAQVSEGKSGTNIDAYFYPHFVPDLNGKIAFFLRVQVLDSKYASEVAKYKGQVDSGALIATPFEAEQVKGTVGVKLEGTFPPDKQGVIVLIPLRDKTIKVWTENEAAVEDFENTVLKNLKFTP